MFTQNQLDIILDATKRTKNQGELAVYDRVLKFSATLFRETWEVLKFCAEECKRQHSGERSVYDMVNAWNYASINRNLPLDTDFIELVGRLVEPIDNAKGFRKVPVGIWDGFTWKEKAPWDRVPFMLSILIESYNIGMLTTDAVDAENGEVHYAGWNKLSKTAEDQFYFEYENIHPFVDGNGRSGKILYNFLNGTLDKPIMPPNFWNSSNP
jgi:hypothetical protein